MLEVRVKSEKTLDFGWLQYIKQCKMPKRQEKKGMAISTKKKWKIFLPSF